MKNNITKEQYLEWRNPRHGEINPQKMNTPVWQHLIYTKQSGYMVNKEFGGPHSFNAGPAWSFDRFGQSETVLPDGRKIYIAGEHEDYYDPDFFIYNDVIIIQPDGQIDIYAYPENIFPPTDFHSATQVGNQIILIGSLSYPQLRQYGSTQVALLNLDDFSIQLINSTGDNPGWIHNHNAVLSEDGNKIIIQSGLIDVGKRQGFFENIDDWELNLTNWQWTRLTRHNWARWQFIHQDQSHNFISMLAMLQLSESVGGHKNSATIKKLLEENGITPDLNVLKTRYRPQGITYQIIKQKNDGDSNIYLIKINNVIVRYVENGNGVIMTIKGDLPKETVNLLKDDLLNKLSRLEGVPWIATEITSPQR